MRNSKEYGTRGWEKPTWAMLVIFLAGIVCCVSAPSINTVHSALSSIMLSIGCSLIASALAAFFMEKSKEGTLEEVEQAINTLSTKLDASQKKLDTLQNTNTRIVHGTHLTSTVRPMLDECIRSNSDLEIDVLGLQLYSFWRDHKEQLLNCRKLKLRMIIQNPETVRFETIIDYEGYKSENVRENINNLMNEVNDLKTKLSEKQNIDIRLFDYPASVTITRVNSVMFVRSRLFKQYTYTDYCFFERYVDGDDPFKTFSIYFEEAWNARN